MMGGQLTRPDVPSPDVPSPALTSSISGLTDRFGFATRPARNKF